MKGIKPRKYSNPPRITEKCWNCGIPTLLEHESYFCNMCEVGLEHGVFVQSAFVRPSPDFIDHATMYAPSPA